MVNPITYCCCSTPVSMVIAVVIETLTSTLTNFLTREILASQKRSVFFQTDTLLSPPTLEKWKVGESRGRAGGLG